MFVSRDIVTRQSDKKKKDIVTRQATGWDNNYYCDVRTIQKRK